MTMPNIYNSSLRLRRILIVVVTIFTLVMITQHAIIACFASRSPGLVARMDPGNVAALRTDYRVALAAGTITQSRQDDFANRADRALRIQPLSVAALSIQGLVADAHGRNVARTRALMQAAESVSRRDLLMQLWLIEDRVGQGDIAGTLKHYDRALSTYPDAEPLLFPILAGAINAGPVRDAFVGYIRTPRPWMRSFLDYATGHSDPASLIPLLTAADGTAGVSTFIQPFASGLLRNVVAQRNFALTRMLAATLSPSAMRGWRALVPSRASSAPLLRPLTWMVSDEQAYQLDFDEKGGALLDIEATAQGIAMYRVIFPRPGTYRLTQRLSRDDVDDLAARWDFTCLDIASKPIASIPALSPTSSPSTTTSTVAVPVGCPAVRVALVIDGSERAARSTLRFIQLDLRAVP